jgi:hypothetical protein
MKELYKSSVLKILALGLVAYGVGMLFMSFMAPFYHITKDFSDGWYDSFDHSAYRIVAICAVIISSVCIFVFNFFVSLKEIEFKKRVTLALTFALTTAPYWFLLATEY